VEDKFKDFLKLKFSFCFILLIFLVSQIFAVLQLRPIIVDGSWAIFDLFEGNHLQYPGRSATSFKLREWQEYIGEFEGMGNGSFSAVLQLVKGSDSFEQSLTVYVDKVEFIELN
jgi:hypothetical protein